MVSLQIEGHPGRSTDLAGCPFYDEYWEADKLDTFIYSTAIISRKHE